VPLAVPQLRVQDRTDGGGVVVTVEGSDPGAANVVSYQSAAGGGWAAGMTVTGDVILEPLAVRPGYWWFKCESTLGGATVLANIVYGHATWAGDDIVERILAATLARVQALQLEPYNGAAPQVVRQKVINKITLPAPCVVLTTHNQSSAQVGGTNARDDYDRPVLAILSVGAANDDATEPILHQWRGRLEWAFQSQRMAGVPEVLWCKTQPAQVVLKDPDQVERVYATVVLRFRTRERRGLFPGSIPPGAITDENNDPITAEDRLPIMD
jgi:hypothetical protein